jgi:hypothetical protein
MIIRKTESSSCALSCANKRAVITGAVALVLAVGVTACHTVRQTDPPRTATEELLISTAADRALTNQDFSWLKGRRIFVEDKYFESYDKGYAVSLVRQCLSAGGGLLTPTNDKADLVVEIRSGALSINSAETLFGVPSAPVPVPLTGAVQLPEIAFYKSDKEDSIAKFALFVYERDSGNFVASRGPYYGGSYYHLYKLLGVNWKRTDVPALKKPVWKPVPPDDHPAPH